MSYYGPGVSDPTGMAQVLRNQSEPVQSSAPTVPTAGHVGALVRRGIGATLLLIWTAIAFSLLTWSVTDPSLTHAASGGVRNLIGPLGAIVSDLLVQILGLASIFAVCPPAYWAVHLLTRGNLPHSKTKLVCAPIAIIALALALSSLPILASWPLKYGYGGMIGDLVYGRMVGLLSVINSARAGAAAGIFGCAVGLFALQRSFGLSNADVRVLLTARISSRRWFKATERAAVSLEATRTVSPPDGTARVPSGGAAVAAAHGQPLGQPHHPPAQYMQPQYPIGPAPMQVPQGWHQQPAPQPAMMRPMMPPHSGYAGYAAAQMRHPTQHPHAMPRQQWSPQGTQTPVHAHMNPPATYQAPAPAPVAPHAAQTPVAQLTAFTAAPRAAERHDEPEFDRDTDQESRRIAERFAPMALSIGDVRPQIDDAAPPREPEIVMPVVKPEPMTRGTAIVAPGGFFERLTGGLRRHEPLSQHYKRPSLNLLKRVALPASRDVETTPEKLRERSRLLLETLSDFGIKGEIMAVRPGPVVTLFEFEPARGTKSSRVIGLADDIARSMSARAVRIAVVPGVNAIGIELPNATRESVGLRDLLETDVFRKSDAKLPLALGKGIGGEPIVADLARMPHLLVAGTTGSGKSVGVNAMILSLLYQLSPDDCRLIMIDPKMLELSIYNDIPHLLTPVVTDPNKAVAALNWAVGEMESRYKRMSALSVRNIEVYNNRVRNAKKRDDLHGGQGVTLPAIEGDLQPLPHIVIVVDEFADLMAVAGKEIEFAVQRLAQMARAAGIHLIMATQRPSVDIITGTIKANFPTRISFRVTSRIDSRTILNEQGAEQLLGQGDMLYAAGTGQVTRVHGPFVSDEEVEAIVTYLKTLGAPAYVDGITDLPDLEAAQKGSEVLDEDHLYDRAVALVRADQKASISYLQRRLSIGYNRAADLIERMEGDGLVGPPNGAGKRELIMEPPAGNALPATDTDTGRDQH